MRYFHAGKALRSFANAMRRKRLNVDEMSDYMRRDLGLIDGQPACDAETSPKATAAPAASISWRMTPYGT